jgi:hypothetical protein
LQAAIQTADMLLIDRLLAMFAPVDSQGLPQLDSFSHGLAPLVGTTPAQQSNTLLLAIATQNLQIIRRILGVTNVRTHIPGTSGQSPYDAAIALFCSNPIDRNFREIFDLVSGRGLLTSSGIMQFARHDTTQPFYPLVRQGMPAQPRYRLRAYNQVYGQLQLDPAIATDRSFFVEMLTAQYFRSLIAIFLSRPEFRQGLDNHFSDVLGPMLLAAVQSDYHIVVDIFMELREPQQSEHYNDIQLYLEALGRDRPVLARMIRARSTNIKFKSAQVQMPETYTVFHISRYTPGGQQQRIFTAMGGTNDALCGSQSSGPDWVSGFWGFSPPGKVGVSFHDGWLNEKDLSASLQIGKWILAADQPEAFRVQGTQRGTRPGYKSPRFTWCINCCTAEASDWDVAAVMLFSSVLSAADVQKIEDYLSPAGLLPPPRPPPPPKTTWNLEG